MKTIYSKAIATALALGLMSFTAQAGPEPHTYRPLKDYAQAQALAPNTGVAVTCPSCSSVTVKKVDKAKSHVKSFECSVCLHKYEFVPAGGGKSGTGKLICKDTKTGKEMPLRMCAEMHK